MRRLEITSSSRFRVNVEGRQPVERNLLCQAGLHDDLREDRLGIIQQLLKED